MGKIFKIKGKIQHYDWGGYHYIPSMLGIDNAGNKPHAEYWLGTHPLAPADIVTDSGEISFPEFISTSKIELLGKDVATTFGHLPYLLKILDVRDMLSIQVHPSKTIAQEGFKEENEKNISLQATNRNYKDPNHKPELIVALGEFWLLHGFRNESDLEDMLESVSELNFLIPVFSKGYKELYKRVMEMPQAEVNQHLRPLIDRILPLYNNGALQKDSPDFWAARASLKYNQGDNIDRGIFSVYFFNLVKLKKGEGMFQAAGVPHAYLEGLNVEIMANSDNVLRGGLTHKHIDVKELMRNTIFDATKPVILQPVKFRSEERYDTPAPDFVLSHFDLKKNEHRSFYSETGEIVLVLEGDIRVSCEEEQLSLKKGESFFVASDCDVVLEAAVNSELYKASARPALP
jgi:mannose-6-phosphate isomerase